MSEQSETFEFTRDEVRELLEEHTQKLNAAWQQSLNDAVARLRDDIAKLETEQARRESKSATKH